MRSLLRLSLDLNAWGFIPALLTFAWRFHAA